MSNIRFEYVYRDGSNYKNYGSVIFRNPENISKENAHARILNTLGEEKSFVAAQVFIPEVFLWLQSQFDVEDDHYFHEYSGLDEVFCSPTDERTLSEFIAEMEKIGPEKWNPDESEQNIA